MLNFRYTGVDRAAGYLRETVNRLVLDTYEELIFTYPITTVGVKNNRYIVVVVDKLLQGN
jgi:hypothetical protein